MSGLPPEVGELLASPNVSGWDLALAAASIIVAWIASSFAKRAVLALLGRLQGISRPATVLAARVVRYAILLVGVGLAFAFLGASIQPLIAVALIVGTVAVLALRGISNNFAAGVVLQTRRPIKVGDEIEATGYTGTVKELNGRSVVIVTRDGRTVHVPNGQLLEGPLVNHSEHGERRADAQVRVRATLEQTHLLTTPIREAVERADGVRADGAVLVLVQAVERNRVTLLVRFWHLPLDGPKVASAVVAAIAETLERSGVDAAVTSDLPVPPLVQPAEV